MRPGLARGGLAILVLHLFGAGLLAAGTSAEYKVVVNRANGVSSLPRKQVSALFLKKLGEWPDGSQAFPVDQFGGVPIRDVFSRDVHGRSAGAVRSYWQQAIFSGRGLPPPEKASDQDVLAYVEAHPGAIGYVSASAPMGEVRVLAVQP